MPGAALKTRHLIRVEAQFADKRTAKERFSRTDRLALSPTVAICSDAPLATVAVIEHAAKIFSGWEVRFGFIQ
jgi:hypothetical protein